MKILRQKEFGRTGKTAQEVKQFFTKVGNPKGINTLQKLSKVPIAPKGGNPITKGNLEHDKKNYAIRNFRWHQETNDPLAKKTSIPYLKKTGKLKDFFHSFEPVTVGIF